MDWLQHGTLCTRQVDVVDLREAGDLPPSLLFNRDLLKFVLSKLFLEEGAKNNTVPHNGANTRRSVLKKLEIEFGKGQYAFYPIKLSRFSEKKIKFVRTTEISYSGTLTNRVKRLMTNKTFKSQTLFLRVQGIQTS